MKSRKNFGLFATIFLMGCSSSGSDSPQNKLSLTAVNASVTTPQNTSASVNLAPLTTISAILVQRAPSHGQVSFDGSLATYRPTDPTYSGPDSFTFKVSNGSLESNEATVNITITPLASGTTTYTENYLNHAFVLNGWQQFTSTFGHTTNSVASFSTGSYNGASVDTRHFGIYGDINSYAGDATYNSLFATLPVDGGGGLMKDWPWKADLIHLPECGVEATVTMKLIPNLNQPAMIALLLNYDITAKTAGGYLLTGYQVLINSGGGSLTLSRFDHVDSLATAYLDRWPNTTYGSENNTNPVISGPYKGWNYRNGVWPAGGNVGVLSPLMVAIHYQYNPSTHDTTISYEARHIDGTDDTPGVWDIVVHLTGADSLVPGGSFGLMPLNYHTASQLNTTDFDIVEYKVQCNLP